MSLESAMNDEMNEVMAILEGRKLPSQQTTSQRASSPGFTQSPVRSMLDVGPPTTANFQTAGAMGRHSSIAGLGVGISRPGQPVRSMLDTSSPPPTPGLGGPRPHRPSHGSNSPPAPRGRGMPSPKMRPEEQYQFGMMPSIDSQAMPKRVTQGGKKKPGAMAGIFGSLDSSTRTIEDRRGSLLNKNAKSKSPGPGIHTSRSQSPGTHKLNSNSSSLMTGPGKYVSDSGQVIDLASAYRRLSDAALLKSGGGLAKLPTRKGVDLSKGEERAPDGGIRLTKDFHEDATGESTDEEDSQGSSDDDEWNPNQRGRGRTRKGSSGVTDDKRTPKSLLAAAEEERKTYQVRSLLEPEPSVTVTGPGGQKVSAKKGSIHPRTSFDAGHSSGLNTPIDSDEEQQRSDITTAQNMTLTLSPIHSTPSAFRCIRQILRGDYRRYQQEAEQGLRRQRMYLVATDLSEEAAYCLEWTIGTVLRDGDTLLAVYAVDEEAGTGGDAIAIGEGANTMKDAAAIVRTLSHQDVLTVPGAKPHGRTTSDVGSAQSIERGEQAPDVKKMDKAERERYLATEEITDRCIKLLRKTKLQVRVVVEVFHCKSPKHMITEVIDYLEPTLVILGSRGRSALKGVLLGSFSNYLVTKSSVPVMVARKKLRKHSKLKRTNLRLSNMLQTPGSNRLEMAKIDIPGKGVGKM